jgi:hypothetical protein
MKSLSQDPQSRNMASLVRKLVVRGPGVSKMASRCGVMGTPAKKRQMVQNNPCVMLDCFANPLCFDFQL